MNDSEKEQMSLSKQRKIARSKDIAKRKRNSVIKKFVAIILIMMIIGIVIWVVLKKNNGVTANSDYSAEIDDNGMIKGIEASDYITTVDYNNIVVPLSELEYSDESVEADIDKILEDNKELSDSAELVAANGDTVNIDYVGTMDGVEFEGGTAQGYDLKLGSGKFIDDFEAQIEGHKAGDVFDVNVTFPDDYSNDPSLAGRDAVFSVTLNGIFVKREFTDEFVQEKLSEYATTADGYRKYLKDKNYKDNLTKYVKDYVINNSEIKKYPSAYLKQMKGNFKAYEISSYESMDSLYQSYYGYSPYASFEDYLSQTYSLTEAEYDDTLEEKVSNNIKYNLFCQAVAEKEGITANIDEAHERYLAEGRTEDSFNTWVSNYGQGYVVQSFLGEKVIEYICERVTVQ